MFGRYQLPARAAVRAQEDAGVGATRDQDFGVQRIERHKGWLRVPIETGERGTAALIRVRERPGPVIIASSAASADQVVPPSGSSPSGVSRLRGSTRSVAAGYCDPRRRRRTIRRGIRHLLPRPARRRPLCRHSVACSVAIASTAFHKERRRPGGESHAHAAGIRWRVRRPKLRPSNRRRADVQGRRTRRSSSRRRNHPVPKSTIASRCSNCSMLPGGIRTDFRQSRRSAPAR